MQEIKKIPFVDFVRLNKIVQEYLPGTSEVELSDMYNNTDNLFVGYYLENSLIGVCFGKKIDNEHFGLFGIAVIYPYSGQGMGSKLLKYFEGIIRKDGYKKISAGSADGYVEHFYLKNSYMLSSLKILIDNDKWETQENDLFSVSKVEMQGKYKKLVIENLDYETTDKQYICKFYNGFECFYVFEKNISLV